MKKIASLVAFSYFLLCLAFAVFLRYASGNYDWNQFNGGRALGEVTGGAIGLFVVTGVLPLSFFAFKRFRDEYAFPVFASWLVLIVLMFILSYRGTKIELEHNYSFIGEKPLVGQYRDDVRNGFYDSCVAGLEGKIKSGESSAADKELDFRNYCSCAADYFLSRVSPKDMEYFARHKSPKEKNTENHL